MLVPALGLTAAWPDVASAAPRTPAHDGEVLEQLAQRRDSPMQRESARLRSALRANPKDPDAAVALAQHLYESWAADGDPRHLGHAQAALAPWWALPAPPLAVRVMRAVLRQLNHDFDAALKDLDQAVSEDPDHVPAWAWIAAIGMVQADYERARTACKELARLDAQPAADACAAQVDAATGNAERAVLALEQTLQENDDADADMKVWVLTRLAETQHLLGRAEGAESAFRRALAMQRTDGYLQAAYADFLLDQNKPGDVVTMLKSAVRSDVLLLRLAIAAKRTKAANAGAHEAALAARFDAARQRGDTVHRKEEARFWLDVRRDPARALPLAVTNYAQQREAADARLLMEAAVAAGDAAAAAPALAWLKKSRHQGVQLQQLATQLKGTK